MAKKDLGKRNRGSSKAPKKGNPDSPQSSAYSASLKLMENKHYGVIIMDPLNLKIIFVNSKLCQALGYSKTDLIGRRATSLIVPEDRKRILETARARLEGKPVKTGNRYTALKKNGGRLVFDAYTNPVQYEGKRYLQTITNDITQQVELEQELRESEEKYRAVVDNIADGIAVCLNGRLVYANRVFSRIFGYWLDEIEGIQITKLIAKGYKKLLTGLQKKVWESSKRRKLEIIGLKKDDSQIILNLRASRIKYHGEQALQLTITDITSEKEAEEQLSENEERYRTLVESVQYGFILVDLKSKKFLYLNEYARSFLKGLRQPIEELDIFHFLEPTDRKSMKDNFRKIDSGKIDGFSGIQKVILPDGDMIWVEYEAKIVHFRGKVCLQGVLRDITEVKAAADKLRESEAKFRQMAENIPEVFWIVERNPDRTVYVSPASKEVFGVSQAELYSSSRNFLKAVHPDDKEWVAERFDDIEMENDVEFRLLKDTGEVKWVRALTFPIRDHDGRVYRTTGIVRDITSRKKTEQQLQASEARYRAVVEDQTEFITRSRPDGSITFLNEACCRYFGLEKGETYGASFIDYVYPDDREKIRKAIQSVSYKNPVATVEHRVFDKNGEVRWQQWTNRMVFDNEGNMQEFLSVGRDITEQKMAEEALRESELKFRAIFENTSDGIAIYETNAGDFAQKLIDCNDSFVAMSGRTKAELLEADDIRKFRITQGSELDKHEMQKLIIGGVAFKDTYAWMRPDKKENFIEYEAAPVLLGERILVYTIDRDITERRKNEIRISESEKKYRKLYESMMDGYARTELGGRILEFNAAFQKMIEYAPEEIVNLTYEDITPEKWHDFEQDILENQVMVDGYSKTYEKEYRKKNGEIFPVELRTYLTYDDIGLPDGFWAIIRDISERKEVEEQLRESEEKYRSVVDNVGIGISLISPDMRIMSLNNQMREWFPRIKVEENPICFKAYNDPPRSGICSYCPTVRTLRDGQVHEDITETPSGGTIRNFKIVSSPITDNMGNVVAAIEMVEDITERIKAEREIQKFKTISDRASYGTVITDMDATITYCNEHYAKMHGYRKDDLIGKNIRSLISKKHMAEMEMAVKELFEKGSISAMEIWHKRKDGSVFPTLVNVQIVRDEDEEPLYISATAIDITDKKNAEAALRNQRDMLRDVTGNVIRVQEEERRRISMELHDSIGQSLSVTKLQIQNLLRKLDGDPKPVEDGLKMISQTMSDTIADLRQISANLRPVILDNLGLWPTIEWYLKDFSKKTELKIEVNIESGLPPIPLQSEVHVFRVIQEIMINIHKHSRADKVLFDSYSQDGNIIFEIYEDGLEFDLERIYTPSARKRGMGLINIMERVNIIKGKLDIKSEPEKQGTRFIVSFPASEASAK